MELDAEPVRERDAAAETLSEGAALELAERGALRGAVSLALSLCAAVPVALLRGDALAGREAEPLRDAEAQRLGRPDAELLPLALGAALSVANDGVALPLPLPVAEAQCEDERDARALVLDDAQTLERPDDDAAEEVDAQADEDVLPRPVPLALALVEACIDSSAPELSLLLRVDEPEVDADALGGALGTEERETDC